MKYQELQAKFLIGRTIKDVQFVDEFPVLVLDNDVCAVLQRDDEGNGPGAISLQHIDGRLIDVYKDTPAPPSRPPPKKARGKG